MKISNKDIIFLQKSGSHSYGLNTATSDEDWRGVALLSDPSLYLGFMTRFEQKDRWEDGSDKVVYEFRKALKLMADGNPSMIELLFTKPEFRKVCEPEWQRVIDSRELFLSRKMKHTYTGYAHSQFQSAWRSFKHVPRDGWSEFDHKAGYKTKPMMHMVRLLRMCEEILRDGVVNVWRDDADELMAIRRGEWTLTEGESYFHHMSKKIEQIDSSLPRTASYKLIDEMCVDIVFKKLTQG